MLQQHVHLVLKPKRGALVDLYYHYKYELSCET